MKKLTFIVLLVFIGFSPLFCEKYGEVADMMSLFISHTNEYADAVRTVETGEELAEIFLKYSRLIQKDQVALMSIAEEYPELADMQEPPEELLPLADKMGEVQNRMEEISMKLAQFLNEPAMLEAVEIVNAEMAQIMAGE